MYIKFPTGYLIRNFFDGQDFFFFFFFLLICTAGEGWIEFDWWIWFVRVLKCAVSFLKDEFNVAESFDGRDYVQKLVILLFQVNVGLEWIILNGMAPWKVRNDEFFTILRACCGHFFFFSKSAVFPTLFWRAEGPPGPLENSKGPNVVKFCEFTKFHFTFHD